MPLSLLAVHLSDGPWATPWLAGGFALLGVMLAMASWKLKEEDVPRIGVLTAAFFIGSSIHFKLVITSVHLILNGLVGVILGRRAPLAISVGLLLQYLLFAHGGLTTLGLNAVIIGAPALAAGLLFPILTRAKFTPFARGFILGAFAVAASVGLNFLVLLLGGKDDWETLANLVLIAHLPLVIVEGVLLGVIVQYVEKVKPEMLGSVRQVSPDPESSEGSAPRRPAPPTADSGSRLNNQDHSGNTSSNGTSH